MLSSESFQSLFSSELSFGTPKPNSIVTSSENDLNTDNELSTLLQEIIYLFHSSFYSSQSNKLNLGRMAFNKILLQNWLHSISWTVKAVLKLWANVAK